MLLKPLHAQQLHLQTPQDKLAYSVGLMVGAQLKAQEIQVGGMINPQVLLAGLMDGAAGAKPRLSEEEIRNVLAEHQKAFLAKEESRIQALREKNLKEGSDFLAKNKLQTGVQTTSSGLQYRVLQQGQGQSPKTADWVSVHYKGMLLSGKEFDSSYKRGRPTLLPLEGIIAGWREGLQLMKEGSKYQFFIPSHLAYGEGGMGPDIEPHATLIFEVELLAIKDPPQLSRGQKTPLSDVAPR